MKKACLIEAAKIDRGKNNNRVLRDEINLEKTLKDEGLSSLQQKWHSRTRIAFQELLLRILSVVTQCIVANFSFLTRWSRNRPPKKFLVFTRNIYIILIKKDTKIIFSFDEVLIRSMPINKF